MNATGSDESHRQLPDAATKWWEHLVETRLYDADAGTGVFATRLNARKGAPLRGSEAPF